MSAVSISIVLEGERSQFRSREPMRGEVIVKVHETCQCDVLRLVHMHDIRYDNGNERSIELVGWTLFEGGPWKAGQEHRYPFEVAAPGFPPTYRGKLMSLTWRLAVTMYRDNEEVVVESLPFEMVSGKEAGLAVGAIPPADPAAVDDIPKTSLFMTAGLALGGVAVTGLGHIADSTFLFVTGIVVGALGLLFFLGSIMVFKDKKRGGNVQVDFVIGEHGEPECAVWTRPDAPIAKIEVKLVASELLRIGPRKNSAKRKARVFGAVITLAKVSPGFYRGPFPLRASDNVIWSLSPGTFGNISKAEVGWEATVEVTLSPPGIITKRAVVRVRPASGAGSAEEGD